MKLLNRIFLYIVIIVLALVFIASALLKLPHIEVFQLYFVQTGLVSWNVAAFLARLAIGVELAIGIFLLLRIYLKQTLVSAILLLCFMTVYLLATEIFNYGNTHCGCFGMFLSMTPAEAILKNVFFIALLVVVYIFRERLRALKFKRLYTFLILLIIMILPFLLSPVYITNRSTVGYSAQAAPVQDLIALWKEKYPHSDFAQGKWCVLFASARCPHCIGAAFKLKILSRKFPEMKLAYFINGSEKHIETFRTKSNTTDVPFVRTPAQIIMQYTGGSLPTMIFITDEKTDVFVQDYYSLDDKLIIRWLKNELNFTKK